MTSLTVTGDHPLLDVLADIAQLHNTKVQRAKAAAFSIEISGNGSAVTAASAHTLARALARFTPALYGNNDPLQATEIDTWVDFAASHLPQNAAPESVARSLDALDSHLRLRTFLVGSQLSLADAAVAVALSANVKTWATVLSKGGKYADVARWAAHLSTLPAFAKRLRLPSSGSAEASASSSAAAATSTTAATAAAAAPKDIGGFVKLPGAEKGKVVTRFPPEASGYLHIGHAKAALLNEYYAREFEGTLIMRFDDTNPAKENSEFEKAILQDLATMGVKPDKFTHTSDHFDRLIELGEQMIREGTAYVDDTPLDQMRKVRESFQPSSRRNDPPEEGLRLWSEMKKGSEVGQACCVRAKIDYAAKNGALRDPVMFRCKNEAHVRTGDKYKVYPTYDFACPVVDSIEGVTHALRTTEYHDRDPQYYWFIEALKLRKPIIYDYARLNLAFTVLSKRKLQKLVDLGVVQGWDDPRFPTVRGVLRRGLTVPALRDFIISQGSSKSLTLMEWDKIWAFNKRHIDPVAPRYTALEKGVAVPVRVLNGPASPVVVKGPLHPKNADVGTRDFFHHSSLLVEREDADTLAEGETVTLMNWGNHIVRKIHREHGKPIASIDVEYTPQDQDFKKTKKLTWIAQTEGLIDITASDFDYLITKPKLEEDEKFEDFLTPKTRFDKVLVGEPAMKGLKKGDVIQLNRRGFYIVDAKNDDGSFVFFSIPDGSLASVSSKAAAAEGLVAPTTAVKREAAAAPTATDAASDAVVGALFDKITKQGDQVRDLKSKKASADAVKAAVDELLKLKAEYKKYTGKDYAAPSAEKKPAAGSTSSAAAPAPAPVPAPAGADAPADAAAAALADKITKQGDQVRDLKSKKADAATVKAAVDELLKLKAEYKAHTGKEYAAPGAREEKKPAATATAGASGDAAKKPAAPVKKDDGGKGKGKDKDASSGAAATATASSSGNSAGTSAEDEKKNLLGIDALKEANFSEWYSQVITRAEMIEYYDVSGCYILRPNACSVWDNIREFFDREIKKMGVENAYFPMFVSKHALEKEKDHIADFAPEVAWVTKSGSSDLAEPIALRPTSETIMYPSFAKWIRSHRDLPLKLNQWANVVRWEFKNPTPFLRTREFLWQEGHTAFATKAEADKEVLEILDLYRRVYEEYLAVPVIPGKKSEKEKFAGGLYTTTVEAFIPGTGRGVQGATSHCLGQNFSKMFEILIDNPDQPGQLVNVWQNSWGLTTRTIGVMIMVHGDNKGLVMPPRVAAVQVVIVPCGITVSTTEADRQSILSACNEVLQRLRSVGVKVKLDDRDNHTPGFKFNHWELRGVPVRIEVGPRDVKNKQVTTVRRDNGEKGTMALSDLDAGIPALLNKIHDAMFAKALANRDDHVKLIEKWDDFVPALNGKNLVLSPWCDQTPCEEDIKKNSARGDDDGSGAAMGAKTLCKPFKTPELKAGATCVRCGSPAKCFVLFGRSY